MKKIFYLSVISFLIGLNYTVAQNAAFPWPDLGEAMVIEPGIPGALNTYIDSDTSATGDRNHHHYILRRGQTYILTRYINNVGYPLMITAEDGDGPLPIIKSLKPEGANEASRPFHAQGNLYIKDLHLSGWDIDDAYTDNATVRLASDGIEVVVKNILFDFNRQNAIRVNADNCKVYAENCIFGDQGVSEQMWSGFTILLRANNFPTCIMRNNTFYNQHNCFYNMYGSQTKYGKLILENNTIMNTGMQGAPLGRPDTLIVKNNLFVNLGLMGDAREGDRSRFALPAYMFTVDTNFVEGVKVDPLVEFDNNQFYYDPAVAAFLPDSSKKMTDFLYNPYMASFLTSSSNPVYDEAFPFTNFPAQISEYENYISDFYEFAQTPSQMPGFGTNIYDLDFSYPTSHRAYTAASDGKALGDRNWFPGLVGFKANTIQKFNVYPNPASDFTRVVLTSDQVVDKLVMTNVLGQTVISMPQITSKDIHINTSGLNEGIYLINFYNNGQVIGNHKLLVK